jgi:hypothetical protein
VNESVGSMVAPGGYSFLAMVSREMKEMIGITIAKAMVTIRFIATILIKEYDAYLAN